jgi:hypothetical protein
LLQGYTKNGAFQLRLENEIGSIEPGKVADFVVLDENLFHTDPAKIYRIQPAMVFMKGVLIQGGNKLKY